MNANRKPTNVCLLVQDNCPFVNPVFPPAQREKISACANLHGEVLTPANFAANRDAAAACEAVLGCWGSPFHLLTPEQFPNLKIVLYSGGAVKGFAEPLKLAERGVLVVSARQPNSVMVARFCLAQILLSCKGFFRNTRDCRNHTLRMEHKTFRGAGAYHAKIALLGMGMVARELTKLLHAVDLEVLAVDPYLSEEEAATLKVRKVTLEQAFSEAYIVSNHLPNIDSLRGLVNYPLLASLQAGATFVNTGRGAQVNETDLAKIAQERPDLTFLLDVTDPEPPTADSPFYALPNIQLSSHIAGIMNNELEMLGNAVVSDLERYCAGQPLLYAEDLSLLDRLGKA